MEKTRLETICKMFWGANKPASFRKVEDEIKEKTMGYSPEEILSLGKRYLTENNYVKAFFVFGELSRTEKKDIANLYGSIVASIDINLFSNGQKNLPLIDNTIAEGIIYCMMESTNMYAEKKISKKELGEIELLIDRINFQNMKIDGREEFNRIYSKFKEYCIDIYSGGKK